MAARMNLACRCPVCLAFFTLSQATLTRPDIFADRGAQAIFLNGFLAGCVVILAPGDDAANAWQAEAEHRLAAGEGDPQTDLEIQTGAENERPN